MQTDATKRETLRLTPADAALAGQLLREGHTVAIPTETVYGLGANALNPAAVEKIFVAKERPHWDPLIVHISNSEMLHQITTEVPKAAQKLIATFWPGPLTLLLKRSSLIPDAVTAGRPLVGVRMPAHPDAQAIIAAAGVPIAAPSANRFGHISPTRAEHVLADLDTRIAAVVDAGPCAVGLESTVLDVTQTPMVIYRPGAISLQQIEAVAGPTIFYTAPKVRQTPESLPSPGVGMRHYAPQAQVTLVSTEAELNEAVQTLPGKKGILLPPEWAAPQNIQFVRWESLSQPAALASTLFDRLRTLDTMHLDHILVPLPPTHSGDITAALEDRLRKAAHPR